MGLCDDKKKCCCTVCIFVSIAVVILAIVLIATSIHVLDTTEMGLLYIKTTGSLDETTLYKAGTKFTKPFSYFIGNFPFFYNPKCFLLI
jgi:hypothetical protein